MGYDADLDLYYDEWDPVAEMEDLQRLMDEQDVLDSLQRFNEPVYLYENSIYYSCLDFPE